MDHEFIAKVVITVLDDDPAKIIECQNDARDMINAGVDFGNSRESLMAEYAVMTMREMNQTSFPEMQDMTDEDENKVMDIVEAHIVRMGW